MKFRNKRSGIVLEFGEDFKQANWEPIEAPSKPVKSEPKTFLGYILILDSYNH